MAYFEYYNYHLKRSLVFFKVVKFKIYIINTNLLNAGVKNNYSMVIENKIKKMYINLRVTKHVHQLNRRHLSPVYVWILSR